MKKIFLALAVLAALIFSAAPSQALVSMPDAVPGKNILLPFFLSKIDSGESTLLVIQDVSGSPSTFAVEVYDIDSVVQYDTTTTLTKNDVASFNVRDDWIANASSTAKTALKIDLDGDGTNDHYAGYVLLTESSSTNRTVGWIYQIDLANGIASGVLAVSEEIEGNLDGTAGLVDSSHIEKFSAKALAVAKRRIAGLSDTCTVSSFSMYPRYFVYNANSENYLFSWRDSTTERTYHLNFYDEAETAISSNVTITHELDILDVRDIVPSGHMSSYPYAGWIDFERSTSNQTSSSQGANFRETEEWIMYNYQKAVSNTAGSNWNALFDVHRDVGTS